ncbi:MAG: helix-turn-helix domain-containing protein [Gammaproteobacteria bacterium]|nr:helix-turn-helix domain-containing protein [Gammaproteobacteria bacterium]
MDVGEQSESLELEAEARDSTRPIRALNRGLQLLAELNRQERAAINTLASSLDLPRTTTYRILETLRLAGYVERDAHDDCYRPTILVRSLADGFDDGAMLAHVARPHLRTLGAELIWPIAIATPSDLTMRVRESTDHQSPLALERHGPGTRLAMLGSASGRVYLAHCEASERDAALEALARSSALDDRLARDRAEVERLLGEIRDQGYAQAHRQRRVSDETSLAVPVLFKGRVRAALAVRFAATALPLRQAVEQFVPKLREAARRIEAAAR